MPSYVVESQEQLDNAIAWYTHNDIDVSQVDFSPGVEFNLAVITADGNAYALELSQSEIAYRAELWEEQNEP